MLNRNAPFPTPAFAGKAVINGKIEYGVSISFDRADHIRSDKDAISKLIMNPASRLLLMRGLDPILSADGDLSFGSLIEADPEADLLFLGIKSDPHGGDHAIFASLVQLSSAEIPNPRLWQGLAALDADEAALYAAARSVIDWHDRHGFCAVCGHKTRVSKGGWSRSCDKDAGGCGAEHFPRVDPVTIMLIEYDGKLLLGRQPRFPEKRYSALAGYIEPGESIEGAVIRETHEEVGIAARDVRYLCSQPWPFPSSLMMGCIAYADDDKITLDETELEDAIWVTLDDVKASIAGDSSAPFIAPPPLAIARTLLDIWVMEQES